MHQEREREEGKRKFKLIFKPLSLLARSITAKEEHQVRETFGRLLR